MPRAPRVPVEAGDTRSRFGHALDTLLPYPRQRAALRRWRHTRPFWGGLLVIAAGVVLISFTLGPWAQMIALSSALFPGIAIGLILIIGGLFVWFAPQQRLFISIVLMICSLLALVVSNLGGFLIATALGVTGSAMIFGWREGGDYKRKGAPGSKPSPVPRGTSVTDKTLAIAAIAVLVVSSTVVMSRQEPAVAQPRFPMIGCGSTPVNAATLVGKVTVVETLTLQRQGCPDLRVSRIFIHQATLTEYHLQSPPTRTGEVMSLLTDLTLFDTELLATVLHADVKLSGLIGLDLPFEPALPSGVVPITPQLVDTLGTVPGVLPLTLNLNATDVSLMQPLVASPDVRLSNFSIRVQRGPTITVPGR